MSMNFLAGTAPNSAPSPRKAPKGKKIVPRGPGRFSKNHPGPDTGRRRGTRFWRNVLGLFKKA